MDAAANSERSKPAEKEFSKEDFFDALAVIADVDADDSSTRC